MTDHGRPSPDALAATLWHATAREHFTAEPLSGDREAEVLVVGGGILGLATALHLAEAGVDTVLVEAHVVGNGASGRNGGLVVPSLPRVGPKQAVDALGPAGARLIATITAGAANVFDLIRRHDIACDAVQAGWLNPAHAASLVPALKSRLALWREAGAAVEWVEAAETRERIGSQRYHSAILDRSGGHINPLAYARGLARRATALGAAIHERSPVTAVRREGDRFVVGTPGGAIRARRVIQSTNAQSPGVPSAAAKSVSQATVPLIVYQMATPVLPESVRARILPGNESMADSRNNLFAMRWTADHRIVLGGMAPLTQAAGATRVPRTAIRRINDLFPGLGLDRLDFVWRGRASLTGDFLPRLFEPEPGWLAPVTCNGRGIVLTTAMGRALARYCVDGDAEALPLPLTRPKAIPVRPFAARVPQLLLPLGIIADRRAERRRPANDT
ncbi:MAG: FAD-binding oxidoreductase [Phycisphaerales bacterium]